MRDTRLARPGLPGLPAGMEITCTRYGAVLACNDPMLQLAYSEITAASVRVPGSPYFLRHWPREMGLPLSMLVLQVRCGAMRPRGAAFRHDDLAGLLCLHHDTIRRFVRWWAGEGPSPFKIPGDPAFIREIVRLYIPRIEPDPYHRGSGSPPHRYWPLEGEVIHPRHLPLLDAIRQGLAAGQREFIFPEVEGVGLAGAGRLVFELGGATQEESAQSRSDHVGPQPRHGHGVGIQGPSKSDLRSDHVGPCPQTEQGTEQSRSDHVGPHPMTMSDLGTPHTPHACMLLAETQQQLRIEEGTEESRAPAGRRFAAAAGTPAPLELPEDLTRTLLALPEGEYWLAAWRVWVHYVGDVRNPVGFVRRAVERAAAGVESARVPPSRYLAHVEETERHAKSQARTRSLLVSRPAPSSPKPEPQPLAPAQRVDAAAVATWEAIGAALDPFVRRTWLPQVLTVDLAAGVLTLGVPADSVKRPLRQRLEKALPPGITLQLVTVPKGDAPHA